MISFALPVFVTAAALGALALLVLIRERASRVSFAFALLVACVVDWLCALGTMYGADDAESALFWARIAYLGIPLIPAAVYTFTTILLQIESAHQEEILASWILSFVFVTIMATSDYFLMGVYRYPWGWYPRLSPASAIYLVFFGVMLLASLRHYIVALRASRSDRQYRRTRAFLAAFAVGYIGAIDYVPSFGYPLYPFGYLAVAGFLVLSARAVWRYRLVDLTPELAAGKILETMPGAVLVSDLDGVIRLSNPGANVLLGYRHDELIGRHISTIVDDPPEITSGGDAIRNRLMIWRRASGEEMELAVSLSPILDDRRARAGTVHVALDISELRRAERSIERLSRQNQLILNAAGEGICGLSPRGEITFLNPAAERMLDCNASELIGMAHHEIFHHMRGDRSPLPAGDCPIAASIRQGLPYQAIEDYFSRSDGTVFPVEYISTPIIEEQSVIGAVVTFNDITERKRSEEQRTAMIRAEEASRAKDELFANVSHELRSPITSILGWIRILESDLHAAPSDVKGALASLEQSAQLQARLVEELLDSARITAGTLRIDKTSVEVVPLVTSAVEAMRPLSMQKPIDLQLTTATEATVEGDPARLRQIVLNLVSNAIKFTPAGGLVEVAVTADEADVTITVADSGNGIAPEFLPFVFDRHRQADSSHAAHGLGLGLAIVRHLVELHQGRVDAASDGIGRGSRFTVTLPRAAQS